MKYSIKDTPIEYGKSIGYTCLAASAISIPFFLWAGFAHRRLINNFKNT
jgi:hypothetical protein